MPNNEVAMLNGIAMLIFFFGAVIVTLLAINACFLHDIIKLLKGKQVDKKVEVSKKPGET